MKPSRAAIVVAIAAAIGTAFAARPTEKQAVTHAADALSWKEFNPQRPGAQVAVVSGDHTKGAWKGFARFPAGSKADVHTHSADLEVVVISGTFNFGDSPAAEKPYGPGSYIRVPAGVPHSNSSSEGCTLFEIQSGKYDTKPVAAAAGK